MDEKEISYRILRKIQQQEKKSPMLSEIKQEFYEQLSEYLKNLEKNYNKEDTSQKSILIKDEIDNTKKIGINIYEQREKKILLAAISKARGGNPNTDNMINAEKQLFEKIYDYLQKSRKNIFTQEKKEEPQEEIKEEINKETKIENKEEKTQHNIEKNNKQILMITEDIPEFIGTNEKKYVLKKNDVISLPEDMSTLLTNRKVAENIKQKKLTDND